MTPLAQSNQVLDCREPSHHLPEKPVRKDRSFFVDAPLRPSEASPRTDHRERTGCVPFASVRARQIENGGSRRMNQNRRGPFGHARNLAEGGHSCVMGQRLRCPMKGLTVVLLLVKREEIL